MNQRLLCKVKLRSLAFKEPATMRQPLRGGGGTLGNGLGLSIQTFRERLFQVVCKPVRATNDMCVRVVCLVRITYACAHLCAPRKLSGESAGLRRI